MKQSKEHTQRTLDLYHNVIKTAHSKIHQWESQGHDKFTLALQQVEEKITEWGVSTEEGGKRLLNYFKRDLQEVSKFIADSTQPETEWRQWLKFDIEQVEQQALEKLFEIANTTQAEWLELQQELQAQGEFHTGEIKSVGALQCKSCGQTMQFKAPGHIPPCPKCHSTVFVRAETKDHFPSTSSHSY